jgi:methionyl aminopeptidase
MVPGARLLDVCVAVEAEIERQGGHPAFPTQTSRNAVAAHYCPAPSDASVYERGDLAKLDIGVHVDGFVVDTALTVCVGAAEDGLVAATRAALDAAIALARPGRPVRELSAAIERALVEGGAVPVRNIGGHGVARWRVHCPPPIPNVPEDGGDTLGAGMTIAIEPFATKGEGLVSESGQAEVFRFDPRHPGDASIPDALMLRIRDFRGLPFARRQLAGFDAAAVEAALEVLAAVGGLQAYAPLVEVSGARVAQTEHTVLVREEGAEVLTA